MTTAETAMPVAELGRRAAIACLVGQIVFVVGWMVAGLLQDDAYSIARHDVSDLGAVGAPHAWVLLVTEGLSGACTLAFVLLGFYPALAGVRGRTLSAVLIALPLGVGYLLDAFFRLDCRMADGCTPEQTYSSWHGIVHASNGALWLLSIVVAPYVVARCLRRAPQWGALARSSVFLGVAIDLAVLAYLALDGNYGAGYAQRVVALLTSAWVALLARRLLQLHAHQI